MATVRPGNHDRGFSLVELMVAVTIAIITAIVVLQVLQNYEARKRTITAGNDAEMSAAVGLYLVEREVRMAGAGLTTPTGLLCPAGMNAFYNGTTISDGAALAPAFIIDGGAGPDRIRVMRSTSEFGAAPGTIVTAMAQPTGTITNESHVGLAVNDLFVVASTDGTKICTLMQMTQTPQASGNGWNLNHAETSPYNPAAAANPYTNAVSYDVGDIVVNMGQLGLRTFGVICDDGAAPSLTNSCNLASYDAIAAPANPTLAQVESLASQVVDFQLQYGVAPAGSQTVNQWLDATGGWAAPGAADQLRIKAIRIAVVTRGNLERTMVAPATLVLWDGGLATERTIALTNDQRFYRYKVLTVIVPLINVIWAGV